MLCNNNYTSEWDGVMEMYDKKPTAKKYRMLNRKKHDNCWPC